MSKTHHLGNYDTEHRERLQRAIEESGRDVSIAPGRYDSLGRCWSTDGISLWCEPTERDLTDFWTIEARSMN